MSEGSIKMMDDSSKSIREDTYKNAIETLDKGIVSAFKQLSTNIFNEINICFSSLSKDYEKRLERNREIHEKAVEALSNDLKLMKLDYKKLKEKTDKNSDKKNQAVEKFYKIKLITRLFKSLYYNSSVKKSKHKTNSIILKFSQQRKKYLLFTSWRNITNAITKGRIKLKYSQYFKDKSEKIHFDYRNEIERLQQVLEKIETDIKKEIDERHSLSYLYDLSLNKGVEEFLKETNYIVDFNSSNVLLQNEKFSK